MGVTPVPPCVVTEYCSHGSLTDVLRAARLGSPSVVAQLDWPKRLTMVGASAAFCVSRKGFLFMSQACGLIVKLL